MVGAPRTEDGYYGTETGYTQVGRGTHVGVGAGADTMTGLALGRTGGDDGDGSGYRGQGGG